MKIPLAKQLKKRLHKEIALLQDEVVDVIYLLAGKAVLHGGTAIWRCHEGNRFSEDLDFYFKIDKTFGDKLAEKLKERNLQLRKYKKTSNVVFAKISNGDVEVRLEINFNPSKQIPIVKPYEKADGSFIDVFTLSTEELLIEKINAYQSRKLIRDIYDVYHLSKYIRYDKKLKQILKNFLSKIEKPSDEENLKTIVYTGAIPSFRQILEFLKSRF